MATVDGYGTSATVERGQLVLRDGLGSQRRERWFPRAGHGLRRVIFLNPSGIISLDALRWCKALRIGVVVLGADGPNLASTPRTTDDARIRRQQALSATQPVGVGIARYLLASALSGRHSPFTHELDAAATLEELREVEKLAADDYWGAWSCSPTFRGPVPAHWSRFNGRTSLVSRANRRADRPMNAVLNYLYGLLEAEAVIACYAVGLDPGVGVLHMGKKARQSMALDLMEPVRPAVEDYVKALCGRPWQARHFAELADGTVRVRAPLTHELAETTMLWAHKLAPHAERVAHMLGEAMAGHYVASTPLTQRARRQAVRRRPKRPPEELERYWAEVYPLVQRCELRDIVQAMGCTEAHASKVRGGTRVPPVSAWAALKALADLR